MRKEEKENCIIVYADEGNVLYSDSFEDVKVVNVPLDFDLERIIEKKEVSI